MTQSKTRTKTIEAKTLDRWLEDVLQPERFKDYCPNGWQVEGKTKLTRLACAVTASQAAIEQARDQGAEALIVHHGLFWKGDDPRLIGPHRRRIATLLSSGMNLWAYHLPLDVHPQWGNNVQLGRWMGWLGEPSNRSGLESGACGEHGLVLWSDLSAPLQPALLARQLKRKLDCKPLVVGNTGGQIRRLGWCTGAAQDFLGIAVAQGCDAFVSGEISERTTHQARELGVAYVAAGHYATERLGVQALARAAADHFGVEWVFIDDPNPV
jgi:dinuclear metal center YbgI/SA1388 family protein